MEWTIDYLEAEGIIRVKASGVMDWDEHKRFAEELYPLASKHGVHKFLIDFREMVPKFTIPQIGDLPDMLRKVGVEPGFKIASVYNPDTSYGHEFRFFSNVAKFLSMRVQQFETFDEALAWLKSD
ncbi:MAG: STAS/SEC14 domain-containing protein [Phycisphaerae bacterium]|nr:STAS/SEC14 domain-containing protein [Phycisphaerae bacterium]